MQQICDSIICTGCQACRIACKHNAITMVDNEKGFWHPMINKDMCVDCGLCTKVCPANDKSMHNELNIPKVLAAWSKNSFVRKSTTSGGIAYELSRYIIENGGVVFGVVTDNTHAKHVCVQTVEDLEKLKGSKYIQSDVCNTYLEAKEYLKQGKMVLFIGTPCQIAALNKIVLRTDNLFTLDIVCHGVPSYKVYDRHLSEIEKANKGAIVDVLFRQKFPDQYTSAIVYKFSDGHRLINSIYLDSFYCCFVDSYCLRESCYRCRYSSLQRVSDITLSDYWGFKPQTLEFGNYKKGVSMIMMNTSKGKDLVEAIKVRLKFTNSDIISAVSGNLNLSAPQKRPDRCDDFWKDFLAGEDMDSLATKYFPKKTIYYKQFTSRNTVKKLKYWIRLILTQYKILK